MAGLTRREWLWQAGGGLGGVAMAWLTARDAAAAGTDGLHHRPTARRVVQIFMSGAASQVDTFDYKPELLRRHGSPFDPGGKVELFQSNPGTVMASPWEWRRHGASGRWVSDLVPQLAQCVDDMAFVYSMVSKSNVHGPATFMQNTGFVLPGFPAAGSWISHGLGSLNRDLPTFVVLPDPRGVPPNGPANWGPGFLPAAHQGTVIRPGAANPIHDLFPPPDAGMTVAGERAGRRLLRRMNTGYQAARPGDGQLEPRVAAYELAARLQLSAPEVLDIRAETDSTRTLYGMDNPITEDMGRRCLITRRLLERDVRFVQIWSGADNAFPRRNWDSHENLRKDHGEMAASMDRPVAALLTDLKQRGLLDDTVILWTTEFGRMPCSQGSEGRDHNPSAFTNWLAGGGIRGGATHGESDEWSFRVARDPTYCYDIHATLLHLLGLDHRRLTFRHNGIDRRLTDVHGEVIRPILARAEEEAR